MKSFTTTITQRGQVTIPAEVRRLLGVKARDKVTFTIEDGVVRLSPVTFTWKEAYGSVTPSRPPMDLEEISRIAKEDKAERTFREMQGR